MRNLLCLVLGTFFMLSAYSQASIKRTFFNEGLTYIPGGGISLHLEPEGVFPLNTTFTLQLVDESGAVINGNIGSVQEFFVPVLNGTLPSPLPAGNYRLQVVAQSGGSPIATSAPSPVFKVQEPPARIGIPVAGNPSGTTLKVNCLAGSNYFGFLDKNSRDLSPEISLELLDYSPEFTYTVNLVNHTTGALTNLPVNITSWAPPAFTLPAGLPTDYYTIEVVKSKGGFSSTFSYIFQFNTGNTSLGNLSSENVCMFSEVLFSIDRDVLAHNYPGSKYTINFGDGTGERTLTHAELMQEVLLKHEFKVATCRSNLGVNGQFKVELYLYNKGMAGACNTYGKNGNGTSKFVNTSIAPLADASGPAKSCINKSATFLNNTIAGVYGTTNGCLSEYRVNWYIKAPGATTFSLAPAAWYNNPSRNLVVPPNVFNVAGTWELKLMAQNPEGCMNVTEAPLKICIEPVLVPEFKMNGADELTGCLPLDVQVSNLTNESTCPPVIYKWEVLDENGAVLPEGSGYEFLNGSGAQHPQLRFTKEGSFRLRLSVENTCGAFSKERTIKVLGTTSVTFPANARICGAGRIIDFATDAAHMPQYNLSYAATDVYQWQITGGAFEFANGTSAADRYPQVLFKEHKEYTVEVTYMNNCGTRQATQILTFTEPVTADAGPATATLCFNDNVLPLTGAATGPVQRVLWTTNGSGQFSDPNSLTSLYTPSAQDKTNGTVTLTLTAFKPETSACADASDVLTLAIKPRLTATNAARTICSGAALRYTPTGNQPGATYSWTATASSPALTGFSASGSGPINEVLANSGLVNATVTYTLVPQYDGCTGDPAQLVVTVRPVASLEAIAAKNVLCSGESASIQLSSAFPGATYSWTAAATGNVSGYANGSQGSLISHKLVNTGANVETVTYTITAKNSSCAGETKVVTLTVNPAPTAANASVDQVLCQQPEVTLNGNTITNGTGNWELVSGPAGAQITNPAAPTTTVTGLTAGNYTFRYVVTSTLGCGGSSDEVTITLSQPSAGGTTTGEAAWCQGGANGSVTLSGHRGNVLRWEASTNEGASWQTVAGASGTTLNYTALNLQTTTRFRAVVQNGGCDPENSSVTTISVKPALAPANAGADRYLCAETSVQLTGNDQPGATLLWEQVGGKPLTLSDPARPVLDVTGLQPGEAYRFTFTVSNGACPSSSDEVEVFNRTAVTAANAGSDLQICDYNGTARTQALQANAPAHAWEKGAWTILENTTGLTPVFTNAADPQTVLKNIGLATGRASGLVKLKWTLSNDGGCTPSSDELILKIFRAPVAGTLSPNSPVCRNSDVTLNLSGYSGEILKWQVNTAPLEDGLFADVSQTDAQLKLEHLLDDVEVRAIVGSAGRADGCPLEATASVVIRVSQPSVGGTLAQPAPFCQGGATGTLTLSGQQGNVLYWERSTNGGTSWTKINNTTASLAYTNLQVTTQYRAVVQNGVCASEASAVATVSVMPKTGGAQAGPDRNLCNESSVRLTGNEAPGLTYLWKQLEGPAVTLSDPTKSFVDVTGLLPGNTYKFEYALSNGVCAPATDVVVVANSNPLVNSINGKTETVCNGTPFLVDAPAATGGNGSAPVYQWQVSTNGVDFTDIPGAQQQTFRLNSVVADTWLRRQATIGACSLPSDIMVLRQVASPAPANAGADQFLCASDGATLKGNAPTTGEVLWRNIGPGAPVFANASAAETTVSGLLPGTTPITYEFEYSINNGVCPVTKDQVKVTVYPGLVNRISPLTSTLCSGQPAQLSSEALSGGNGIYEIHWQSSANGQDWTDMPNATAASLTVTPSASLYYRRVVTSGPCAGSYSQPAHIEVQAPIAGNSIAQDRDLCINTAAPTITGSQPTGGNGVFRYLWEQSANGTDWTVIPGADRVDYAPGVLTQTTWYRRRVETDLCAGPQAHTSNPVKLTVRLNAKAEFNPAVTASCAPFELKPEVVNLQPYADRNGTYQWFANGNPIGTGAALPGYTLRNENEEVQLTLKVLSPYGCTADEVTHTFKTFRTPQPAFTLGAAEGCGPLTVLVKNTTPGAEDFAYRWDFGNGQTSTAVQPGEVIFNPDPAHDDAVYTVKLQVFSNCINIVPVEHTVTVKATPKASFAPSKTVGCTPMEVTFNNTSLGRGNTYTWDFGDGSPVKTSSTNAPVQHTYYAEVQTTHKVTLVATNGCGSDQSTFDIVVAPSTVKVDFAVSGTQKRGCAPLAVNFVNNSSGAATFTWTFEEGVTLHTTKNSETVPYTFKKPGTYKVTLVATNGCSTWTDEEVIEVYGTPAAAFTPGTLEACIDEQVQFTNNSTGGATSYQWNFADGVTDINPNPSHAFTAPGNYGVVLKAIRQNPDGSSCSNTTQPVLIKVGATKTGAFDITASGTCAPALVTFTNRSTPAASVRWDFGDNTSATGSQQQHSYANPGRYTVTMTAVAPGGCTYTKPETVVVNGPQGSVANAASLCNGEPARFEVTMTGTSKLLWEFGDGTTQETTGQVVSHPYAHAGTYRPKVTLVSNDGCTRALEATPIVVDKVESSFTYTQQLKCGTTTVTFTETSRATSGKQQLLWEFGDSKTGTGSTVPHEYSLEKPYEVVLTTIGQSGCRSVSKQTIPVQVNNIPAVAIASGTEFCANAPVRLSAVLQSEDSISSLKWTVNGATATTTTYDLNLVPGTYPVKVEAMTVNGCKDEKAATIRVNPAPVVTTGRDETICRDKSIQLTATGGDRYSWSPLQGLSCANCANPVATPTETTSYVVTGTNAFGCTATDTVLATVVQRFRLDVKSRDSICIGQSSQLMAKGGATYSWTPATGLSATNISNPVARPMATTTYTVLVRDSLNCFSETASVEVAVGQVPTLNLGPDQVLSTGAKFRFQPEVVNGPGKTWSWSPATDLDCATCATPEATIKRNVTYTVKMTTPYGCTASDTISFKAFCQNTQVFIPNAFTPDGDGINDVLMVRASGVAQVKTFRIFNRWGDLVFERTAFAPNSPAFGWDGRVKGIPGAADVYVYTCEVICENNVPYTYKGNISLLK
ncbi:PKD domain-containing protein [Paraflavisolibacter sp. H34]|uniref:PKD domain-containing protein n=1 Tax=Huijunlia imazamoxiresistens TaxID=3127457 RepID=UPI003019BD67